MKKRGTTMKFDPSCIVFQTLFSKYLVKYYKEKQPEYNIKQYVKPIKKEYKAMLLRTPSLSKDNYMAGNLKGAAYFLAAAKIIPDITPEIMDDYIYYLMTSDLMKKIYKKARVKGTLFSDKEQDKMYKDSLRSQKSDDEMDWKFTYEKGKDECRYNITKCGVCRLAERENLLDFLPCLCKMDYPKYEVKGAILDRTKTLANGDDCCNFHLIRKK